MPLTVLLNVFVCSPIPTHYNILAIARVKDPHSIKCIDENALGLSTRALHIITDWFLLPVPITIIWRLQMPLTRKIRLILIFCVGFISSVASIMRNVLIERLGGDLTCKSSILIHCTVKVLTVT